MNRMKTYLGLTAFVLLSIILVGIYYLITAGPTTQQAALGLSYPAWVLFAYAAGLTMIFLPCTLPLAFVIVPMAMGENRTKGLIMALLFGAGLTLTITLYTTAFAVVGGAFGFNQAAQLAEALGDRTGLEVLNVLSKVRRTQRQSELRRDERLSNLQGAFALNKDGLPSSVSSVLVVDDVYTTGSTLRTAAEVLQNYGITKTGGLVLARTLPKK